MTEGLLFFIIFVLLLLIIIFLFLSLNNYNVNIFPSIIKEPTPLPRPTATTTSQQSLTSTLDLTNIDLKNISKYSILEKKNNDLLKEIGKTLVNKKCYTPCNPSFVVTSTGELMVVVRFVNYVLCGLNPYTNPDMITLNVIATIDIKNPRQWTKKNEKLLELNIELKNDYYSNYGLEDIRLFKQNDIIYYTATVPVKSKSKTIVELGCISENEYGGQNKGNKIYNNGLIYLEKNNIWANMNNTEKNWVLFTDASNRLKIIYKWYPLIVCDYVNYTENLKKIYKYRLKKTHEIETIEQFRLLRGTTNGVNVGTEIWFVCHTHDYYHCIVVLNNITYKPIKYSHLFKMNNKSIEFCIGFFYFKNNNSFLLGYGIQDKITNYICIEKTMFEKMMIYI
jgi:hypothetical protein